MQKLKKFKEYINKINQYEQAANVLQWDMQTCMPYNGGDTNTEVLTMLSSKSFELSVSDEMKNFLDNLTKPEIFNNLDNVASISQIRVLMSSSIGFLIGESDKK